MRSTLNHRYPTVQGELESEFEGEFELESEFEGEDEFEEESEFEDETEFEFEFEAEAEREAEFEDEEEYEDEAFVNPVQRIYRDAELMAHLAGQASRVEGEAESEAFIGALVPMAARLIPRAANIVARNAPTLIRSAIRTSRRLRRDPATRQLVRAVPVLLQRTAQSLSDQARTGQPITAETVARTFDRISGRVFASPATRRRATRAVTVFDQRYHRRADRGRRRR